MVPFMNVPTLPNIGFTTTRASPGTTRRNSAFASSEPSRVAGSPDRSEDEDLAEHHDRDDEERDDATHDRQRLHRELRDAVAHEERQCEQEDRHDPPEGLVAALRRLGGRPAKSCWECGVVANVNAAESGIAMSANTMRPARAPQSPALLFSGSMSSVLRLLVAARPTTPSRPTMPAHSTHACVHHSIPWPHSSGRRTALAVDAQRD